MLYSWRKQQQLDRLRVKTLLYQFVHELLLDLQSQYASTVKRDLAAQAAAIIHEHYAKPITLELLSESLNYSIPHLSSYFKIRTGLSPIDYLIQVRIEKAAVLLLETDAVLKEIAIGVGYQDPSYLSRLFKKYKGVSPKRYREMHAVQKKQQDSPSKIIESSIVPSLSISYTDIYDNDYQHQNGGEEDLFMFKQSRPTLASVLLLSFILVMSACGTNGASETAAPQSSTKDLPAAEKQPQTKIIKTVNGDVEVPLHPKRIIAGEYLGSLIALGITPVGTDFGKGGQPIYNGFGFKPPAKMAAEMANPGWASFSPEALPDYTGDYIILTSDSLTLDALDADPIWSLLPAVKNKQTFVWTSDRSGYWDPIAILSQTEELAAWLTSRQ
ncbi:helix-turn-helix domain-containing protein [Paenibacillaceae bacterium]|nr:helix-turn-helix domain-containing protein [Paenibacillaceae bacterium]